MVSYGEYNQEKGHKRSRNRRVHLKRKLKDRYGLDITNSELKELLKIIKSQKGSFEKTISDGNQIYMLLFQSRLIRLLYDPYNKEFITALHLLERQSN